jgi:hypothetical protein
MGINTMTYELYDSEWKAVSSVQARSFKEARAAFAALFKGSFWVEHTRSGEAKKVRLG